MRWGAEPIVRGLYSDVSAAISGAVGDDFDALRTGNASERRGLAANVDAASEWLLRGRLALLPTFADLVRARGAVPPATFAALVGLPSEANLTALQEASVAAARVGADDYDARPLLALRLAELYASVESVDALVGLMVEPPTKPLTQSVGPTLASCVREQLHTVRAADRFWHDGVIDETRWAPMSAISSSLLRYVMVANFDFGDAGAASSGASSARGILDVPATLADARDAVTDFVDNTMTGGSPRSVRLGFHISANYGDKRFCLCFVLCLNACWSDATTMSHGSSPNCFAFAPLINDTQNAGLQLVPEQVRALRQSTLAPRVAALSDADLYALIGAVGATTSARGGLKMAWHPGRVDVPAGDAAQAMRLCPAQSRLPDAFRNDSWPHMTTLQGCVVGRFWICC